MLKFKITKHDLENLVDWEGKEETEELIKSYKQDINLINNCIFSTYGYSEKVASFDILENLLIEGYTVVCDEKYNRFKINIILMLQDYKNGYITRKNFFIIRRVSKKLVRELNNATNKTQLNDVVDKYYDKYLELCNYEYNRRDNLFYGFYIEDWDEIIKDIKKDIKG